MEYVEGMGVWDEKLHYGMTMHGQGKMLPVKREVIAGSRFFEGLRDSEHLDFTDSDTAKRFAKALKHAVKLCVAKHPKEPF